MKCTGASKGVFNYHIVKCRAYAKELLCYKVKIYFTVYWHYTYFV